MTNQNEPRPVTTLHAVFARSYWMLLGPIALLIGAVGVFMHGTGWFTGADAALAIIAGAMIGCRWYDLKYGSGLEADGQPDTPEGVRRYTLKIAGVAIGAWVIGNLLWNVIPVGA